ncbi:related to cutinase precursor [Rhynchosporium graminicola]|uniref:Cutinase n=1 Tax=Rhynchosporium graminicola TaxID=2792576 RepID=A0A1E1LCE7_9HELO|nr:related to cutinase precursor [Rhynchosporium commune]
MLLSFWTLIAFLGLILGFPVPAPLLSRTLSPKGLTTREVDLNTFLSLLLNHLPPVDGTLIALSDVLTTFQDYLAYVSGKKTTYNQFTSTTVCKPYTVIFARGTFEPGNVGILVGPPFFDALRARVGAANLTVLGVNDYKASVEGYLAGGDVKMGFEHIATAFKTCPHTKLVVSGYSQGSEIVRIALASLPAATAAWVSKVVVFGDPNNATAIPHVAASKVLTVCHKGDDICKKGIQIVQPHLTYGLDVRTAATFALSL